MYKISKTMGNFNTKYLKTLTMQPQHIWNIKDNAMTYIAATEMEEDNIRTHMETNINMKLMIYVLLYGFPDIKSVLEQAQQENKSFTLYHLNNTIYAIQMSGEEIIRAPNIKYDEREKRHYISDEYKKEA